MNQINKTIKIFIFFSIFQFLACTRTPDRGPLEVKYDRDRCSECGMAISDQRFAAQIRGGKDHSHNAHKFDDIGCAMRFARKQTWFNEKETESYVMDYENKKWIDSLQAKYKKIKTSPMGYGYSAHEKVDGIVLGYDEVAKKIGE